MRDELSGLTISGGMTTSYAAPMNSIMTAVIPLTTATNAPNMTIVTVGDLLNSGGIKAYKHLRGQKIEL